MPMMIFGFYVFTVSKGFARQELTSKLDHYNARTSDEISNFIEVKQVLIDTFLDIHALHDGRNITAIHDDISTFVNNESSLVGISFLDNEGAEVGYFGARSKMDYLDNIPLIIRETIATGDLFIGTIKKNPVKKMLFITLAFPTPEGVVGQSGRGALVAELNMKALGDALGLMERTDLLTLVFTKSGFLIYSSTEGLSTSISDTYRSKISLLAERAKPGEIITISSKDYAGVLSVNPVTDWLVYTEQPLSVFNKLIFKTFKSSILTFIYILAGIFILAFFLSLYVAGIITKPIKAMTKAVNIVEEGRITDLPPLPAPNNEIGVLSMAFARMLDSIKIKFEALSQDRQDLEELNQSLELRVGSRTKELRTALNELIKKERLAAIGQMASIVSHEIKNPLAVIKNAVYLIKARMGENADPRILKNIDVVDEEIRQANGIIEEILGYARSRDQILTVLDLSLYMREILASYPMPQNVQVITEFWPEHLNIKIDSEEMKQAIRNVIGNAVEVMPEGGQLIVKTKLENDYVSLSIRDTGPGIAQDIQEKIFAPFFTTKARGTGLGLAVVKKVAGRNNADIILQSEEGKGTKITMLLKPYKGEV